MYLLNRGALVLIFALVNCSEYKRLKERVNNLEEKLFFDSREFREDISLLNRKYNTSYEQRKEETKVIEEKNSDNVYHNLVLIKRALSEEKAFTRRSIDTFAEAMNNFNQIIDMLENIKNEISEVKEMQETCDKKTEQIYEQQKHESRNIEDLSIKVDAVTAETIRVSEKLTRHVDVQESISKTLWHVFGTSIYFVGREAITWKEAMDTCKKLNGYLAEIGDSAENDFLVNLAKSILAESSGYGTWIGGSDSKEEGTWMWEHSESNITFFNWGTHEPNGKRNENCLHFYKAIDWKWNDARCTRVMAYICERDM